MAVRERLGPHRGFFDLWSRFYDLPPVQRLTYRPVQNAVLEALRRGAPQRVLDLGCGTGLFTARIARELHGVETVGCDFSAGMLGRARDHGRDVRWVQGDATFLPFADASFDAVVSTEAFHWFPDPERALTELHRVLVHGGRLLVALVHPPLSIVGEIVHLGSRIAGEPFYWPTRRRMRRLLTAAGFGIESQTRVFRLPAPFVFPAVLTIALRRPGPPGR